MTLLHVYCDHRDELEEIATRVLKSYSNRSGKARFYAKVDYAYWLARTDRSEKARDKSCQIFEECTEEAQSFTKDDDLVAYCCYFHTKILVGILKEKTSLRKQDFFTEILKKTFLNFLTLSKACTNKYRGDLFLLIAEVRTSIVWKRTDTALERELVQLVEACKDDLGCNEYSLETCIGEAEKCQHRYRCDRKFRMRIGKLSLEIAYETEDLRDKTQWFTKALDLSRECSESPDWYFMCSSNISQALLNLWAIDLYNREKPAVEKQYRARTGTRPRYPFEVLRFLVDEYYNYATIRNCSRIGYLTEAKKHLELIVERGTKGWVTHGVKLARVNHLLAERPATIISTFEKSLQELKMDSEANPTRDYMIAHEKFGRYYEVTKDFSHALFYYDEAIQLAERIHQQAHIAKHGKNTIRTYNNDYFCQYYRRRY
ncbi:uncharacterized protein [Watersipora subatra]|uniref:uncharacterized protein n=1 Tax=Watersipora subatra TaxID=2589382 RepID=UPI00355C5C57